MESRVIPAIMATVFDPARPDPEYTLAWPRQLFAAEASALVKLVRPAPDVELLLEEAFAGSLPREDFARLVQPAGGTLVTSLAPITQTAFVQSLVKNAGTLPTPHPGRPFWPDRHGRPLTPPPQLSPVQRVAQLQEAWTTSVNELHGRGYLGQAAPRRCVDNVDAPDPDLLLADRLNDLLRRPGLWPLRPPWDEDLFYGLIEAVGDLVARPRSRSRHDFNGCGWHYATFAPVPGRAVYRWRVNDLLARHDVRLRLATSGDDEGRLVRPADDDRDQLLTRALATPKATDRDTVKHAVSRFRSRTATREDKRLAVVGLIGIIESRRQQLTSAGLSTKDSDDLFNIANNFHLRHNNPRQLVGYDEAYLEWLFWWYLATVELTHRLVSKQASP